MIDVHRTFPESRRPLRQLTNVPVDELYVEQLTPLLEAHGAKLTLTDMKRYPLDGPQRTYFLFTIDFPEGTYRADGMLLARSTPFTIFFPDGFEQPGTELFRFGPSLDLPQNSMICLYLRK